MPARPYRLIVVLGATPQILTETIWSLARQQDPPWLPVAVDVLTTGVGQAFLDALLLGRPRRHPLTGRPIPARDHWTPFCHDVLDGATPPLIPHLPRRADGSPLPDIRNADDDGRFADLCYRLVAERTRQAGDLPVVGSVAGGRKTMSAHLMTAFALFARPQDRLVHVLVNPPDLEHRPDFFYPDEDAGAAAHLDRVELLFPRLRSLLGQHLPAPDREDPARYVRERLAVPGTPGPPARLTCQLAPRALGGCRLDLEDAAGAILETIPLRPTDAATLLVLAEATREAGGPVPNTGLVENAAVEARRAAVVRFSGRYDPPTPWTATDDISKQVSRLNARLRAHPLAAAHLAVEAHLEPEATRYGWPTALPPVRVVTPLPGDTSPWPFAHLPLDVRSPHPPPAS